MAEYRELLIGCGNRRGKVLGAPGHQGWSDLTTLDFDPDCKPDVEWDLNRLPLPFGDEAFDEVHAYHTLEHIGAQGDFRTFFAQFSEFYRILRPGGYFCGIVPAPGSPWVFGDPGHTRFLPPEIFTFLSQAEYTKQVGVTAFADYRRFWRGDFEMVYGMTQPEDPDGFYFVLRAVKPAGIAR